MSWWLWVIVGAILLGAELTFVSAEFYLVFIGAAAVITGLVAALAPALAVAVQWLIFAALLIVSMVAFRGRVHAWVHAQESAVPAGPASGGMVTLPAGLAPGDSCQVEHGGSFWTLRNDGAVALPAGSVTRITRVQGLTLIIQPGV
jgi:membrane protein implicated in regulation of membrane protease activity